MSNTNTIQVLLTDLKKEYKGSRIPYAKLLLTNEWSLRRDEIILRDKNICQNCLRKGDVKMNSKDKFYYRSPTIEEIEKAKATKYHLIDNIFLKSLIPNAIRIENPIILHVHHKVYYFNEFPWESLDEELVTLCHECHFKLHKKENIVMYKSRSNKGELELIPCFKCNGARFLLQFNYYHDGICFSCSGNGYINYYKKNSK